LISKNSSVPKQRNTSLEFGFNREEFLGAIYLLCLELMNSASLRQTSDEMIIERELLRETC
jgi:hypothetical protein